ncbi:hypothetical protein E5K00_04625 [Hymenobacter aquaticus]|uniref:Uncharacterized protein n=1 Tax=Hymenobacter aquaticus TaxID=1867101 RepID=A0A4Z0Q602_9BACT|nr:hypothetical protein [Hymenobacter aquaticus]TGE24501.1 hypothetical protein E5K00_04625 [Hymenobacter aquaticus]
MIFTIDNRHFEILHATDIPARDGLAWELWEHTDEGRTMLVEIFRHDDLKRIDFQTFGTSNIPYAALEVILHDFDTTGGKEFMDTPLKMRSSSSL